MKKLLLIVLAAALTACAATGPAAYGPADDRGFGYAETKIEDNRFRIVYGGSGGVPPEVVEDFALRRAAELARDNGYDWFQVVGSSIERELRGGVSLGAGVGSGSYGRSGGVNVGVGGDFGRVGAQDYFTVRMEVLLGVGARPDAPNAYNASSVLDSLVEASISEE